MFFSPLLFSLILFLFSLNQLSFSHSPHHVCIHLEYLDYVLFYLNKKCFNVEHTHRERNAIHNDGFIIIQSVSFGNYGK